MKSVLISIQPKWCELIASGKKTVEVRKTKPKLEIPFKAYIYETKDKKFENIGVHWENGRDFIHNGGKVIGEFVCDGIYPFHYDLSKGFYEPREFLWGSCLSLEQLKDYVGGSVGCGWHITDLVIYDNPKELNYFCRNGECKKCGWFDEGRCIKIDSLNDINKHRVIRAPQYWCYVEDGE